MYTGRMFDECLRNFMKIFKTDVYLLMVEG